MPIDPSYLRKSIRSELDTEDLLNLLDRAIELIPEEQWPEWVDEFFDLDLLSVDEVYDSSLLEEVSDFYEQSLAGLYYEDFAVNSKNFTEQSRGTINWISECKRLIKYCIQETQKGEENPELVREAFEKLFSLLDELDKGNDEIIFFADEGGSWQVGVDWEDVLPSYFKILALVAEPKEYAECVIKIVKSQVNYDSKEYYNLALKQANSAQKKALKSHL